jgi:hypothetical protein
VNVPTTKPERTDSSLTENVRPHPGRRPRLEQKKRRPRTALSESFSA